MLDFIVPLVMGEDHLGLSVGLTQFAAGVGSIIGGESSGAMAHMHGVFYFAGTALVLSGVCAVVLHVKVAARVMVKDLKQEDPPENGQARDIRDGEGPGRRRFPRLLKLSLNVLFQIVRCPHWALVPWERLLQQCHAQHKLKGDRKQFETTRASASQRSSVPQGQVTQAGTEEPSTGKITFGAAVIFPAVLMSPVFLSNTIDGIESEGVANGQKLRETYDIFYGLFGIIAGILIVMVGYRYVALAGAVMGILGNLIAAASPRSLSTLSASIGFLNGSEDLNLTVAVLEYHKEKSLRFLVSLPPGTDFSSAWRFVHGYHTFYYSALVIPGAACLAPLNLIMEGTRKETYVSRALSIKSGGLELLKSPVFYVLVGVFFCTGL
ncbi:hypothetical protein BaRGS_00016101, partial [Batillaria attramentaria]